MVIRSEGAVEYVMVGVSRRPTQAIWRGKDIEPVQWYWDRTRDQASHDPIPIPLGYRGRLEMGRMFNLGLLKKRLTLSPVLQSFQEEVQDSRINLFKELERKERGAGTENTSP
ncbi:hypothetical protein TNCV_290241 [Trichonephila clavipes]|nr:hypothetical protein TNCV_290241 [Trichonephila clavipes]